MSSKLQVKNKFFDADNDGNTTVSDIFYIVRMAAYLGLAGYAIIVEGKSPEQDVYTDIELITIIVASFGSGMMDTFIRAKFILPNRSREDGE